MKKRLRNIIAIFVIFFSLIIFLQFENYHYPKNKDLDRRINYLEQQINMPLDSNSDIYNTANTNPEFVLFTYAFTTYALTNISLKDSTYKQRSLIIIVNAIERSLQSEVSSIFNLYNISKENDFTNASIIYLGHLNLMLGCYDLLSDDTTYNALNDSISKHLLRAYHKSKYMLLESYPAMIWIADNTVAIASLKLYYKNTAKSEYNELCEQWLCNIKEHYTNSTTQLFYSTVSPFTGEYIEEVRGSMIGWSIMFMNYIDADYAQQMYANYKKSFSKNFTVFRLFKERYKDNKSDIGDIDSGPIIRGYSIPANQFALANAVASGDKRTAKKMERLINFGTKKIKKDNKLRYETRFYKEPISPMSEALMLFALTL